MLDYDYTTKLLGIKDVIVKNMKENGNTLEITLEMPRKTHKCPCCQKMTDTVHDYRMQSFKHIPIWNRNINFYLHKRRYRCSCGKRFVEKNTFLPRYHRMSNVLVAYVLDKLCDVRSFTSIAKEVELSVTTVIRIFDLVGYAPPDKLPEVVAIDEFKGNADNEKYLGIITDPKTGVILDILPKRHEYYVAKYFSDKDRQSVKYFVSDMWRPYENICKSYFKESTFIVDKYHWIRQVIWAFENVRK